MYASLKRGDELVIGLSTLELKMTKLVMKHTLDILIFLPQHLLLVLLYLMILHQRILFFILEQVIQILAQTHMLLTFFTKLKDSVNLEFLRAIQQLMAPLSIVVSSPPVSG